VQFTDLALKTLPQGTHWDSHTRGLGLRVGKNARTFIVLVRSGQRKTLGRYPYLSLREARAECNRLKAEALLGRLRPARVSFDQALSEYLEDCKGRLRPRSLKNYRDYLSAHFRYGRRSLSDITTREIITSLRNLSPSQREHATRIGRTFFTWCVRHSLLDQSPMQNMPPIVIGKPRQRVLTEDELRAVWTTARTLASLFHAIVALLVLTGQRRGEIAALQWDWIEFTEFNENGLSSINFPAHVTKNGRMHSIPYSNHVAQVLQSIPHYHSQYVFPASRHRSDRTTTFNAWSKSKVAFDRECGVSGYTLHDLRRTFATNLQRLGVRLEVTEALLNHVSGTRSGIVGVYQTHRYETEARAAILTYEAWLTSL
jgi:integrase